MIPAQAASAEPIPKARLIIRFVLMPIKAALVRLMEVARIAVPVFVFVTNRCRPSIRIKDRIRIKI
ncbi:hypothetical protein D3C77_614690 [compost metagenome]